MSELIDINEYLPEYKIEGCCTWCGKGDVQIVPAARVYNLHKCNYCSHVTFIQGKILGKRIRNKRYERKD